MMSKIHDLLHLRFRNKDNQQQKMNALVERSNNGELSSFSGVFRVTSLSEKEREDLEFILREFKNSEAHDLDADLKTLMAITSEVKAITNQAAFLHGERIKKAQDLLKRYRDGAFTAWLFTTYGNRQTPYNFLQYFEFYNIMPEKLHPKLDQMPRQVIYSLASRSGEIEKKQTIVDNYSGQTKQELLRLIRQEFPLPEDDKRSPQYAENAIQLLKRVREMLKNPHCEPKIEEKQLIKNLLGQIHNLAEKH